MFSSSPSSSSTLLIVLLLAFSLNWFASHFVLDTSQALAPPLLAQTDYGRSATHASQCVAESFAPSPSALVTASQGDQFSQLPNTAISSFATANVFSPLTGSVTRLAAFRSDTSTASSVQLSLLRELLRNRAVLFLGDSTAREIYQDFAALLNHDKFGSERVYSEKEKKKLYSQRHSNQVARVGSSRINFVWAPFRKDVANALKKQVLNAKTAPDAVIVSVGLWDLLRNNQTTLPVSEQLKQGNLDGLQLIEEVLTQIKEKQTKQVSSKSSSNANTALPIVFLSAPSLMDARLTGHRQSNLWFRDIYAQQVSTWTKNAVSKHGALFADLYTLSAERKVERVDDDGVHSVYIAQNGAASVATTLLCLFSHSLYFPLPPLQLSSSQAAFFLFTFVCIAVYVAHYLFQFFGMKITYSNPHTVDNGNIINMLSSCTSFFLSLRFVLPSRKPKDEHEEIELLRSDSTENTSPTNHVVDMNNTNNNEEKTNKESLSSPSSPSSSASPSTTTSSKHASYSAVPTLLPLQPYHFTVLSAFIQLGLIMLLIFTTDGDFRSTWRYIGDREYNRDIFIYVSLSLLFLGIQSLATTSHADFLNRDQTEEWKGWMQLLFVLYHYFKAGETYNVIRIFIAAYVWMTGYNNFCFFSKYNDYSFVRLIKMLFRLNFLVVIVMIVMRREYIQYYVCGLHTFYFLCVYITMGIGKDKNKSDGFMALKIAFLFVVMIVLYDIPNVSTNLFNNIFAPFPFLWYQGSLYEWLFRTKLDHLATVFGMIFAWQLPRVEAALSSIEGQRPAVRNTIQTLLFILFISPIYFWFSGHYFEDKFKYNDKHFYVSILPILGYVLARNVSTYLRKHCMFFFTWFGKVTLETYILQFHLWLSDDAGTKLLFWRDLPLLNFVIMSCIFLYVSYLAFHLTTTLSDFFIPKGVTSSGLFRNILATLTVWYILKNLSAIALLGISFGEAEL